MKLKDIVAISGKPGLYEIKAQSKGGLIVSSLLEDKKFPVSVTHNISALNEIAIYTYSEEVPLKMVLKSISEFNGEVVSPKDNTKKITDFFREVLPEFDEERVYTSNIKKVLQWYHILASKDFDFSSIEEVEEKEA